MRESGISHFKVERVITLARQFCQITFSPNRVWYQRTSTALYLKTICQTQAPHSPPLFPIFTSSTNVECMELRDGLNSCCYSDKIKYLSYQYYVI